LPLSLLIHDATVGDVLLNRFLRRFLVLTDAANVQKIKLLNSKLKQFHSVINFNCQCS